jgi:N-acetylmuramic acid 6-phosphate etherase
MVDMMASNRKLKQRSRNILRELSKRCDSMTDTSLDDLLARCDGSVKLALVVAETDLPVGESRQRLHVAGGVLVRALTPNDNLHSGKSLMNGFKRRYPVLCVDGGGSKCAAVVATSYGVVGMGVAGPCNL